MRKPSTTNVAQIIFILVFAVCTSTLSFARGGGGHKSGGGHSSRSYSPRSHSSGSHTSKSYTSRSYSPKAQSTKSSYRQHTSKAAYGVQRDSKGKIKRSASAKHDFMKQSGHPNGRPGYVVDHVVPLKRGGADAPSNMQWQTKAEAKAKDKWE